MAGGEGVMAWSRQHTDTSVTTECSLSSFSGEQLLQGLVDENWLSEKEAESILNRQPRIGNPWLLEKPKVLDPTPDVEELSTAREDLAVGRRFDALVHLERYLGRDWIGVLAAEPA
jgi:hypothetical protein